MPRTRGRAIRRRCAAIVRALRVPDPFDLDAFLASLAADRGRPIRLVTLELPPGAPCGLCVSTDTTDYIAVTASADGAQRDHIALHEVAHLLLDHQVRVADGVDTFFSRLDPATVRAVYTRSCYDTEAEQEAETLASLLGLSIHSRSARTPVDDPLVRRLGRSLGNG